MDLRLATVDDLDVLVRHRRLMWVELRPSTDAELDDADRVYHEWLRVRMAADELVGWVIESAGEIVASGCLWLQPVQPRPGHALGLQPYLLSMYTAPSARGTGCAGRIVDAAVAWARERGHPRVGLHASTAGRPVYEKRGFGPTPEMWLRF